MGILNLDAERHLLPAEEAALHLTYRVAQRRLGLEDVNPVEEYNRRTAAGAAPGPGGPPRWLVPSPGLPRWPAPRGCRASGCSR